MNLIKRSSGYAAPSNSTLAHLSSILIMFRPVCAAVLVVRKPGQPELTPFDSPIKEAEPSGTIFVFVRGCKKGQFYSSLGEL